MTVCTSFCSQGNCQIIDTVCFDNCGGSADVTRMPPRIPCCSPSCKTLDWFSEWTTNRPKGDEE